jgi:membrane protein
VKDKIQALKKWFFASRLVRDTFFWSKKVIIPGFGGMSIFAVLKFVIESFQKTDYGMRSSAIAFKFFLALFPSLLFFVSIIPFIPIDNFQDNLMSQIDAVTPDNIYPIIETTINDLINTKHHLVLGVGLIMTLFYASNGINAMLTVFNRSHQIELRRNPIKQRVIALILFASISVFIIVALVALTLGEVMIYSIHYKSLDGIIQVLFQVLKWLIMVVSLMLAMGILFNLGNPEIKSRKWITPGTSLATILIIVVSTVISYFFANFGSYNELYGSIGTLMMVLIWLNSVCYVILIGFELHTLSDFQRKKLETASAVAS